MEGHDTQLTPDLIMQVGMGFTASRALLSAIELGVFTELAAQPMDLEALRGRLKLHARSARDFFDALVALGFLTRDDAGVYRNSPEADLYLDRAKPTYLGNLEMASTRLYKFWGSLTEALRTGLPQNEAKDDPKLFEKLYADPARLKIFLRAMTGLSTGVAREIAQRFPWRDYKSFADVGAAQGACPAQVALAHPHLEGIGFDLAPVKPIFEEYIASLGIAGRVRFQVGDFFKDSLPRVDVIVMGHILHDWNLEQKKMLVKKVYGALPKGGAFIVYEGMIDDERRSNTRGLLMSLNMLIETPGGFDYTPSDCRGWMKEVGFGETRVEALTRTHSMVFGIK